MFSSGLGSQKSIEHDPHWGVQLFKAVILTTTSLGLGWITSRIWRSGETQETLSKNAVTIYEQNNPGPCVSQSLLSSYGPSSLAHSEGSTLFKKMGIVYRSVNPSPVTENRAPVFYSEPDPRQAELMKNFPSKSSQKEEKYSLSSIWDTPFDLTFLSKVDPFLSAMAICYAMQQISPQAALFTTLLSQIIPAYGQPSTQTDCANNATFFSLPQGYINTVPNRVAFSPDGAYVAITAGSAVLLYKVLPCGTLAGGVPYVLAPASGGIPTTSGVAFSPSGNLVAVANPGSLAVNLFILNSDGTLSAAATPAVLPVGSNPPSSIAFSPDGLHLATLNIGNPSGITVFSVSGNALSSPVNYPVPGITSSQASGAIAYSHNGKFLAVPAANSILIYTVTNGLLNIPAPYGTLPSGATSLAFTSDDAYLIVGGNFGFAGGYIFSMNAAGVLSGQTPFNLPNGAGNVTIGGSPLTVAVSSDRKFLATGNTGNTASIINFNNGTALGGFTYNTPGQSTSIAFDPNSAFFATGNAGTYNIGLFVASCPTASKTTSCLSNPTLLPLSLGSGSGIGLGDLKFSSNNQLAALTTNTSVSISNITIFNFNQAGYTGIKTVTPTLLQFGNLGFSPNGSTLFVNQIINSNPSGVISYSINNQGVLSQSGTFSCNGATLAVSSSGLVAVGTSSPQPTGSNQGVLVCNAPSNGTGTYSFSTFTLPVGSLGYGQVEAAGANDFIEFVYNVQGPFSAFGGVAGAAGSFNVPADSSVSGYIAVAPNGFFVSYFNPSVQVPNEIIIYTMSRGSLVSGTTLTNPGFNATTTYSAVNKPLFGAYSPDGSSLAMIEKDLTLGLYGLSVYASSPCSVLSNPVSYSLTVLNPTKIAFSANGSYLAIGGSNGIEVFKVTSCNSSTSSPTFTPTSVPSGAASLFGSASSIVALQLLGLSILNRF